MYLYKINYKLLILVSSMMLFSCGDDKTTAPNLSGASSQTYELYKTIDTLTFANSGGNITSCAISPDLPTGLQLSNSCTVSGAPVVETSKTKYKITASNEKGADTAEIYIATEQNKPALTNVSKTFVLKANIDNFILKSNAGVGLNSCVDTGNPTLASIGLAVNVSEDKTSCVISGTLKDSAIGTNTYTISATNNKGTNSITLIIKIFDNTLPVVNNQTISSKQGIIFKGTLDTIADLTGYTFTIKTEPSKGTVSIPVNTDKKFTYEYTATDNSTNDSFVVTANHAGKSKDATITINIALNDPLYQFQWHLHNTGQTAFAKEAGTAGSDLNMQQTVKNGYTGFGVKVSVVDTGLEIAHEDLVDNIEPNKSCNIPEHYTGYCEDQNPTNTMEVMGDHGTSVAGLIAATGWNNKGGRGVAPDAKLRGFNLLKYDFRETGNYTLALGGSVFSSDVDIFNQSYGVDTIKVIKNTAIFDDIYWNGVENLRDGKGAIYIKSAGNGFSKYSNAECNRAHAAKVSCQNANMDPKNAQPYNIIIGAINADDKISSYSTWGSNIWISTYGGEYGRNYSGATSPRAKPAMLTTDQSGCDRGYSATRDEPLTPFHDTREGKAGATYNSNCNYASTFNGTSSAAPVTSGAVALLLEANSNLTWRDVKHILAKTATQIDTDASPVIYTTGAGDYTAAAGWITNDAGFKFHNAYGFGKINVDAAISMATNNYQTLNPFIKGAWHSKINLDKAIPDNSAAGVSDTQNINENLVIESVQVEVNITHTFTGDLGIELTSPSGTKSILFNIKSGFGNTDNLEDMQLLSNAFYGESSHGNWTLKVVDAGSGHVGKLNSWKIKIYGH